MKKEVNPRIKRQLIADLFEKREKEMRRRNVEYKIEYLIYWRAKEIKIDEKMAAELKKLLEEISKEIHIKIIKEKIEEDGVKLKINSLPSISPSEIVKKLKGKTSRKLNKEKINLWKGGYYIKTI